MHANVIHKIVNKMIRICKGFDRKESIPHSSQSSHVWFFLTSAPAFSTLLVKYADGSSFTLFNGTERTYAQPVHRVASPRFAVFMFAG